MAHRLIQCFTLYLSETSVIVLLFEKLPRLSVDILKYAFYKDCVSDAAIIIRSIVFLYVRAYILYVRVEDARV
jgi:hypothetical protein